MDLDHLRLFQRIVALGSMAAAARDTGLSTTTVSERLASLEAHFGIALLNRTTRSLSLTDAGRTVLEGANQLLEDANALRSTIRHGVETLSGTIRISAPHDLGRTIVSDQIAEFQRMHPQVVFEIMLSDGYVDVVGLGIDIALRFGAISDTSLRVRPLGAGRRIVCAAPRYLESRGRPLRPADLADLADHDCLVMRFGTLLDNQWKFGDGTGATVVSVRAHRVSNDGNLVRLWCLAGAGIALKSEFDVSDDIREGRLVPLLEQFPRPPTPLQMLFPPSRRQPRRVSEFADQLFRAFRELPTGG